MVKTGGEDFGLIHASGAMNLKSAPIASMHLTFVGLFEELEEYYTHARVLWWLGHCQVSRRS